MVKITYNYTHRYYTVVLPNGEERVFNQHNSVPTPLHDAESWASTIAVCRGWAITRINY